MKRIFRVFLLGLFFCTITSLISCSPNDAFKSVMMDISGGEAKLGEELAYEDAGFTVNSAELAAGYKGYHCEFDPDEGLNIPGKISVINMSVRCSRTAMDNCVYTLNPYVTHQTGKSWGSYFKQTGYSASVNLPPGGQTEITFAGGLNTKTNDKITSICFLPDDLPTRLTIGLEDGSGHEGILEFTLHEE